MTLRVNMWSDLSDYAKDWAVAKWWVCGVPDAVVDGGGNGDIAEVEVAYCGVVSEALLWHREGEGCLRGDERAGRLAGRRIDSGRDI